jgi:uncharacterized membrane protein
MNKGLLAAVAVAAVMLSGTAMAETTNAKIRKVDTENNQLTLKNGFRFTYGDDINEAELTEGSFAKVTYKKKKDGQLVATKVVVRKPEN